MYWYLSMKQSDDIGPTLSQQQKTFNIWKDQDQKVYGWHTVGFTIACRHILNNQTMHLSVWSNGPMLAQWHDLKPNLWQNMQLVQRRANVCNLTPLNILTNAILTVLAQRKFNIVWPTPTCFRHPNILPKLAQYVHADWVFVLSYNQSIWMFNARDFIVSC